MFKSPRLLFQKQQDENRLIGSLLGIAAVEGRLSSHDSDTCLASAATLLSEASAPRPAESTADLRHAQEGSKLWKDPVGRLEHQRDTRLVSASLVVKQGFAARTARTCPARLYPQPSAA